jgi:hypothetical protein
MEEQRKKLKSIARNTIIGIMDRVKTGEWCGGRPPWGYDLGYYYSDKLEYIVRYLTDGRNPIVY